MVDIIATLITFGFNPGWFVIFHNHRNISGKQKGIEMKPKTEGTIAIVVALFVLFSAMWDPRISVGVSVVALAAFGVYKFVNKDK
jgi:hypothetical protein